MPVSSLKRRLILGAALWLAVALGAGAVVLGHAFRDSVEHGFHERLGAHLRALLTVVEIAPDGTVTIGRPLGEPRFEQAYSGWYWQVSDGTSVRARSRSLWDFALPVFSATGSGEVHIHQETGPRGESLEVLERDLLFPDGGHPLHLSIAANRREVDAEVGRFDLLLAASLGGLGLGLVGAVALQVGYGLRPLARLAGELETLRSAGGRIDGDYPSEVAPLVAAMNQVLDHDARLIERARAHMGNLAHGLKTPLAVLEAELASSRPDSVVLGGQIERLNRLVDIHLNRARAEAVAATPAGVGVMVAGIVDEIAAALRKIYAERDLTITAVCAAGSRCACNRDDLAEILGNLMDNACKWARHRVRITADTAAITVEDDGPGLTPEQADAATRRGIRLDETAPGSGLGLAIVADLAGMMGLGLEFGRSDLGGLLVRVILTPSSPADRSRDAAPICRRTSSGRHHPRAEPPTG
jgi:signal transduction histidine kinase